MDFGSLVLVVEILLLVAGWLLFQHARSELTARAAQMPVLSEVKALQKSILALLEQLKLESMQTSAQLEARCREARELLAALERQLEDVPSAPRASARRREKAASEAAHALQAVVSAEPKRPSPPVHPRYREVYALADEGLVPATIAQQTGLSEGEVELILGLRPQPLSQ